MNFRRVALKILRQQVLGRGHKRLPKMQFFSKTLGQELATSENIKTQGPGMWFSGRICLTCAKVLGLIPNIAKKKSYTYKYI